MDVNTFGARKIQEVYWHSIFDNIALTLSAGPLAPPMNISALQMKRLSKSENLITSSLVNLYINPGRDKKY